MRTFNSAEELLEPGETGLFLFTGGQLLTLGPDGSGSSGNWKLDPNRTIQRVVVCRWSLPDGERIVELFSGLLSGIDGPTDEGRYTVRFHDMHPQGTTSQTWEAFTGATERPVAYVRHASELVTNADEVPQTSTSEPPVTRFQIEYADGSSDEITLLQRGECPLFTLRRKRPDTEMRSLGAHSAGAIAAILFRTAAMTERTEYPCYDPKFFAILQRWFEPPQSGQEESQPE
ncbi:MAG: hypothetical protein ACYDC1_18805 [Limisphaerales bacterium]